MKIMESIPNISEGRRPEVIAYIATKVREASSAKLLHIDSNADANRTVFTLAGTPDEVRKSTFILIQASIEKIDMRLQTGVHPRLGAVDVCPFVPVKNMTLQEAARQADILAGEVASQLNIPIYFYEKNASCKERKNLAFLRRGEYEHLSKKMTLLPPDLGPQVFSESVAKTGACVMGARPFLIAFNISLNTQDLSAAKRIASALRERDGGLPTLKAIGWLMPGYQAAQVSFNLTDFHTTGLAQTFESCRKEAQKQGLEITGSELIGLAPQEAFLEAGRFYAPQETDPATLTNLAIERLGLNKIRPFNGQEQILENCLAAVI